MARKRQTKTRKLCEFTVVPLKDEKQLEKKMFRNLMSAIWKSDPNRRWRRDIICYYKTKLLPHSVVIATEKQGERYGVILYFRKGAKPCEIASVLNAFRMGRTNVVTPFSSMGATGKKPEVFRSFINQETYNALNDVTTAVLNAIAIGETPTIAALLTKLP